MSEITKPTADLREISKVSDLLDGIAAWRAVHSIPLWGYHSHAWLRGHSKRTYKLAPGVYRDEFTNKVLSHAGTDQEAKRLDMERMMLMEFRTTGTSMIPVSDVSSLYVLAQHYGMPTRLLDWTTNPLTALFFAVSDETCTDDGDVFVMEPSKLFDEPPPNSGNMPKPYVRTMRHPQIRDVIGMSFWEPPVEKLDGTNTPLVYAHPHILALQPDNVPGRIGQQSSCFTLHTHLASDHTNPTLGQFKIIGTQKVHLREELRQLNINEFTVYNDLDHLSREMKKGWGV